MATPRMMIGLWEEQWRYLGLDLCDSAPIFSRLARGAPGLDIEGDQLLPGTSHEVVARRR